MNCPFCHRDAVDLKYQGRDHATEGGERCIRQDAHFDAKCRGCGTAWTTNEGIRAAVSDASPAE